MVTIDLITGFLGSGKTSLIRDYASYLMKKGENLGILENDYGAVNVDMMLLGDLEGDQCELEMVAGGCDYDCHKRRFKTKLISMGMYGYDRVLVEPSGIFDVDEFFDVLREDPLDRWYQIGNVICVVDAGLEKDLSPQAQYLLASQLSNAGKLILTKCDLVSPEKQQETLTRINQILEKHQVNRRFELQECLAKPREAWTDADFEAVSGSGYVKDYLGKFFAEDMEEFDTCYFMNLKLSEKRLLANIERLFEASASFGQVFRVKGFYQTASGWMEVNATRRISKCSPIRQGQEVLIVIGEHLDKEKIQALFGETE